MKDRLPLYPGRVKLVPVSGQENVYDMTRADQPTQEGDPLNKATLLKDATASLFGLGADSVPDEVFAWIGKYNLHWWQKYHYRTSTSSIGTKELIWFSGIPGNDVYATVVYSNTITVSGGTVELTGQTHTVNIGYRTVNSGSVNTRVLNNQYFYIKSKYSSATSDLTLNTVYYCRGNLSLDGYNVNIGNVYNVNVTKVVDGYVQSSDSGAYPESGEQGGYEYQYLGIPFDNAVTAPKITTGSYVGTGTYGESNPNSLTFDFEPKAVVVFDSEESGMTENASGFIWIKGIIGSISYNDNKFTQKETTLSWYTDTADNQLNHESLTYVYLAIG